MNANLTPAEWQLILDALRWLGDEPQAREVVREQCHALVMKLKRLGVEGEA